MARKAQNQALVKTNAKANSRAADSFDDEDTIDVDFDRDELAALTASQGRSPVMLSSDDALYG